MHAYLIVGQNEELVSKKIDELSNQFGAAVIEFPFTKISDIKELTKFTNLKLTQKTVLLLKGFDESSPDAQNAFLKSLEEPQKDLYFILTAKNREEILPTILSRCEVVELQGSQEKVSKEEIRELEEFIKGSVGVKLKKMSTITKRDEAISFMNNFIITGHQMLLTNPNISESLESANNTLKNLKMNGNITLQLTNFVVNLT